jgi:hypothetical protein
LIKHYTPIFATLFLLLTGCNNLRNQNGDDQLLAEAYGSKLYLSELEIYLENAVSTSDSQYIITKYVDNWLMDEILYNEAHKVVATDQKIKNLVKDYEKSMYINEYEKVIISNHMDTMIQKEEIDSFFKFHKNDFFLQEGILRFLFIKIPEGNDNDTISDIWKTEDLPALKNLSHQFGGISLLKPNEWQYISSFKNLMPENLFKQISLKKPSEYIKYEDGYKFYIKILELINDKEATPVGFVEERIKQRILHNRMNVLLKNKKNELFDENIKSKSIKIYNKVEH